VVAISIVAGEAPGGLQALPQAASLWRAVWRMLHYSPGWRGRAIGKSDLAEEMFCHGGCSQRRIMNHLFWTSALVTLFLGLSVRAPR
jgi:hypothetical protein